jgi:hypothetical protein
MEAKPKQAAREELRYESMMQRVPHGIRALLSHGALPGSPGAEFANGLKARWDKAQALGWTRTEFDNRSEADH